MFEKDMRFSYLLDLYGKLLDEHTRDVLASYYEEDMSLGEIAEERGISRQGVRHAVKHGEELLSFYEERLSLSRENEAENEVIRLLSDALASLPDGTDAKEKVAGALTILKSKGV